MKSEKLWEVITAKIKLLDIAGTYLKDVVIMIENRWYLQRRGGSSSHKEVWEVITAKIKLLDRAGTHLKDVVVMIENRRGGASSHEEVVLL